MEDRLFGAAASTPQVVSKQRTASKRPPQSRNPSRLKVQPNESSRNRDLEAGDFGDPEPDRTTKSTRSDKSTISTKRTKSTTTTTSIRDYAHSRPPLPPNAPRAPGQTREVL